MRYLIVMLLFTGCTVQSSYVAADRATFEALEKPLDVGIQAESDPVLRAGYELAKDAWEARIKEGE